MTRQRKTPLPSTKILYTNARGIRSKLNSLQAATILYEPDLILLTETKIVGKTDINIKGYKEKILRNRTNSGGGILIAKRNESKINMVAIKIHEEHEQMWIKINNIIIALVYGLIESRTDIKVIEDWYYELEKQYSAVQDQNVIIIGDINAHVGNDHLGVTGNHEAINKSGEIVRSFMERRDLTLLNNTPVCNGRWTREDPSGSKSILDLVITNINMTEQVQKMIVDEEHNYKVSRKKRIGKTDCEIKSDHNTILIEINTEEEKIHKQVLKTWNIKNEESWKKYHHETQNIQMASSWDNEEDINIKFSKWKRKVKSLMYKHLERVSIKIGKVSNNKIKIITKRRKALSKEIDRMKKNGLIRSYIIDYMLKQQEKLRKEVIDEVEEERLRTLHRRMEKLRTKVNITNEIWKVRKRNYDKAGPKLAIRSKEGQLLTDMEQIHTRYTEYYQDLLKNREVKPGYEEYGQLIENNFNMYCEIKDHDNDPMNKIYTRKELDNAIKSLQKEKSTGPDGIYNELFIHAGNNLRNDILEMFNSFWKNELLPEDLYKVDIKSIYKGKGDTSNLENHRGLFLSNTIIKLYEKMILNRANPNIEKGMSRYQAGGRKNYSIKEHVFIVRSIINKHIYFNQPLLIEFIDLRKAFDKMVLKNVMLNLWEIGIKGKIWRVIYNINQKAIIRIKSNMGSTDELLIGEILKQGSVLAANLAALHTDSLSKRFDHTGLGTHYGQELIPLLLYQDDIVKFDANNINMQKSNIILETFQNENKIEYHKSKSVIMSTHTNNNIVTLNNVKVPVVTEYKYLGDIIAPDNSLESLINERRNIISGTTAEIISISAETRQFSIIAAVQYISGIITPKLLLNAETWDNITSKEMGQLEQIYSQSIKRLLHLPFSTPTFGLYNELGIWRIESQILQKQLMFIHKMYNKTDDTLVKKVLLEQMKLPGKTWIKNIKDHLENMKGKPSLDDLNNISKIMWKKRVHQYVKEKEQYEFEQWGAKSSKCKHMKNNEIKMKTYIQQLSPRYAKIIMEVRLGIVDVKVNYKNKYENLICRNCLKEQETTEHFFRCLTPPENQQKINLYGEIYQLNDIKALKVISEHLYKIITNNEHISYKEI